MQSQDVSFDAIARELPKQTLSRRRQIGTLALRSCQEEWRLMMFAAIAGSAGGLGGLYVVRLGVHLVTFAIFVVVPHPGHRMGQALFVSSFWRDVQPVVGANQDVQSATVG